ncbi:hypothetical protein M758_UG311700 [Ceratodon purpureus]|nr:hypothetical protein M758_UG311700 [Ceratodon purpureus]
MVEEVLHTQRDFKDILLRLVNSSPSTTPAVLHDSTMLERPTLVNVHTASVPVSNIPTTANQPAPVPAASAQPSWMSAETVLLTLNTKNIFRPLRAGRDDMIAVSADVSDQSIANGSVNDSIDIPDNAAPERRMERTAVESCGGKYRAESDRGPPPRLQDPHGTSIPVVTMETRGKTTSAGTESADVPAPTSFALRFPSKAGCHATAVNKLVYLTHSDMGDQAVAEGRSGGSWKAKAQKLGNLCDRGEQMVQVHKFHKFRI